MSQKRLDRLFEGERASLAKLDQMVKDEENKIAELRQSVRHIFGCFWALNFILSFFFDGRITPQNFCTTPRILQISK